MYTSFDECSNEVINKKKLTPNIYYISLARSGILPVNSVPETLREDSVRVQLLVL
jgi:hypothetical protein